MMTVSYHVMWALAMLIGIGFVVSITLIIIAWNVMAIRKSKFVMKEELVEDTVYRRR